MTSHPVGTRDEWRAARVKLLEAEKDLTRRSDELARQRMALPWVEIDQEYRFATPDGTVSLLDLFGDRTQLIVYHFMFCPDWTEGCPSCSSLADGYDGVRVHLEHHDVAFVTVSRAPIEKLLAYRERMGWRFPWVSSFDSSFNFDFGVSFTERQLAEGAEHNFRLLDIPIEALPSGGESDDPLDAGESPGMSAFARDGDRIFHTYSAYARGCDVLWGMYQWLDRAPLGRNEDGMWFKRHDQYDD
jgi:predicted dithiol-disulfide oxidoreductase (DUF899 family)